jgi:predicted aspartyl protease
MKVQALWDTGADGSVISPKVVDLLGLLPSGATEVYTANGIAFQEVFDVSILLPGGLLIDTEVTCADLTTGQFACLIGMDVIEKGDFAVSNFQGKTVFTFRYPSVETIDFRDGVVGEEGGD